jgi:hypothetical protein
MVQNDHSREPTRTHRNRTTKKQKQEQSQKKKNRKPVDFGRDLLDEPWGPHKIKEVKIANFVERKLLRCDRPLDGVGKEEGREGGGGEVEVSGESSVGARVVE